MEVQTTKKQNIQKSSKEKILKTLTPEKLIERDFDMLDIVKNSKKMTTVGSLKRDHGSNFSKAILMGWLVFINEYLNKNKSMNRVQIKMTATLIEQQYYWLSFQDLALVFKNIISGVYGDLYECFDSTKLLGFIKTYAGQRTDLSEELQINKHNELKSREKWNK